MKVENLSMPYIILSKHTITHASYLLSYISLYILDNYNSFLLID